MIGFTNSDGNGVYGVEATYNEYLKGTNGKYITAKDSVGKSMPFKYESYINAENGANLVVTIDLKIQYDLETQVQAAYDSAQAGNRVCGIAMDPNTGAILAMAVYPNYDLNSAVRARRGVFNTAERQRLRGGQRRVFRAEERPHLRDVEQQVRQRDL